MLLVQSLHISGENHFKGKHKSWDWIFLDP
jgi:hypothetical protein